VRQIGFSGGGGGPALGRRHTVGEEGGDLTHLTGSGGQLSR
jgi:hypothetical protein